MRRFSSFFKNCSFLFGIILFLIIILRSDFNLILKLVKNINLFYLSLAALLNFPMLFIRALNWNYLKKQQGIKYSLKDSFLMNGAGTFIGLLTPGRLGEIIKALYLKKDGYSLGKSLVSVILDKISDFAFLLIFLLAGSLFFLSFLQKQILILVAGIIIISCLLFIFIRTGLIKFFLKKLFYLLIPLQYQKSWKINFQDFLQDIKAYKLKNYLIVLLIVGFHWFIYYYQAFFLAKGISIELPFLYLALAVTAAGLITLIPVSISGIGTRDASLIILFSPFLIPKEQIIIFSNLILLMSLVSVLIGLICWLIKPINLWNNNQ